MLAQAVLGSYLQGEARRPGFSVTSLSLCEYEMYIRYKGLDMEVREPIDYLRMEDGNWQEAKVVQQLLKAGFRLKHTGKNQMTVNLGRAGIRGRPDGLIEVSDSWDIIDIKAMNLERFTKFKQKGLSAFPAIKTQVQAYMASTELQDVYKCWLYATHKDSCRPYDIYEERDLEYIKPVIEAADAIILDGYTPEKEKSDKCAGCSHKLFCWGDVVNLSGIKVASLDDAVEEWLVGRAYQGQGKILVDEARELFKGELGGEDMLLVEGKQTTLKVSRVLQHRNEIDMVKFIEKFGPDRLPEVLVEKTVEQIRVSEVQ